MKLKLVRKPSNDKNTPGELFIDGEFFCHTLEDIVRAEKEYGETAIPAGTYEVSFTYSPKFKMFLPLLLDVPGFDYIRIHAGNSERDTEGCILIGERIVFGQLWYSKRALKALIDKIAPVFKNKTVIVEITQEASHA